MIIKSVIYKLLQLFWLFLFGVVVKNIVDFFINNNMFLRIFSLKAFDYLFFIFTLYPIRINLSILLLLFIYMFLGIYMYIIIILLFCYLLMYIFFFRLLDLIKTLASYVCFITGFLIMLPLSLIIYIYRLLIILIVFCFSLSSLTLLFIIFCLLAMKFEFWFFSDYLFSFFISRFD